MKSNHRVSPFTRIIHLFLFIGRPIVTGLSDLIGRPTVIQRPTIIGLLAILCLSAPGLLADEIRFKDGTEIKDCLVRDEGRIMRVWLSRDDFPDRSRAYLRDEVERFRIRRGPEWDAHEDIQDLSVTHIELSPPLIGLHGCYHYDETGTPSLRARQACAVAGRVDPAKALAALPDLGEANRLEPEKVAKDLKLAYEEGEQLTLTAHVKNTGFAAAAPFEYRWTLNGREVGFGKCGERLGEMEDTAFDLQIQWPGNDPVVRFEVIPGTREIADFNNLREEVLTAFAFDYCVTHRRIAYSHRHRNTLGSFSWEDYYQWHLDIMNRLFAESVYPSAPRGIEARVRLNRIFYLSEVEDQTIDDKVVGEDGLVRNQGAWHFRDNENEKRGEWWRPDGNFNGCVTEWSLPHELGHQLGLIDLYNFDYHGQEAFLTADFAHPQRYSHFFRHPRAMMHWHGPHLFHEVHAEYLNRTRRLPRGAYGDFTFPVPDRCYLQVLDVNGRPVPFANVEIYQRGVKVTPERITVEKGFLSWYGVEEKGNFPSRFDASHPVIYGMTDELGLMRLPNRAARALRTLNGYERKANPFGNINVVGQRGLMLALVNTDERTCPFFLELIDFNLACIRGETETFTMTLQGDFPSADGPPPPAAVRLEHLEGGNWRLHWAMPDTGVDTTNRNIHRFRVFRRCANEGLNFDPWDPVATLEAGARSLDLPGFPQNPGHAVGARRYAYGITSVNERGVQSGVVARYAPPMERVTGLIRTRPYGPFYLTLEGDISLVRLGSQGRYEDATPVGAAMEKAGDHYAINRSGRMVSTAWDRHGVNLFDPGMKPRGGLGEPFRAGEEPGRFRHPRDCALDEAGNVAVADGENRRVQLFKAETVWGDAPTPSKPPALIIDGYEGAPYDCRLREVELEGSLCLVHDERSRLYAYRVNLEAGETAPLCRLELNGRAHLCIEDDERFLVLNRDRGRIRRYTAAGVLEEETTELCGEKLLRPQGLVQLHDGRLAVFQDLNRILIGRFPRAVTGLRGDTGGETVGSDPSGYDAPPLPELTGVYSHPIRYETPELRPKVLVINYDPLVPAPEGGVPDSDAPEDGEVRLSKAMGWQDPHELTDAYVRDLRLMSGGYLQWEIVEWKDVDGWPVKVDGFTYTDDTYLEAVKTRAYHEPDIMDYRKFAEAHGLAARVAAGEIDEVWVWGGPGFGYYESRMFGPGAYWCNSTGVELPAAKRLFVVMGFNYERGLAEMIHDLGHRTESVMSRVYEQDFGPWEAHKRRNDWERFSCVDDYVNGWSAVGNCHFPCNGTSHYDYANTRKVMSFAADWLNYPGLKGVCTEVDREVWADPGGDYHLGYMRWLFSHLPRAPGVNREGRLCNWWNYLFDMSTWPESR